MTVQREQPDISLYAYSAFQLTRREIEILHFMAKGYRNKQIAQALHLSPYTVRDYLSAIYSKMGVANRTEAMREAISHRIA